MTSKPWVLENATERSVVTESLIPRLEVRENLMVGWYVKLSFVPVSGVKLYFSENLWARVTKRKFGEDETMIGYAGILESVPQSVPQLERGEMIDFAPNNVVDYLESKR